MRKKIIVAFVVMVVIFTYFVSTTAHALFYSGTAPYGTSVTLTWQLKYNYKAYLRCNGDSLGSLAYYNLHDSTAINRWINACSNDLVIVDNSPVATATVFLDDPTVYAWNNMTGIYQTQWAGFAEIKDDQLNWIKTLAQAQNSSGNIIQGQIWLTPRSEVYSLLSDDDKVKLIEHELGHVLCLGHSNGSFYPTTVSSVMKTALPDFSSYPQQHDINEIAVKY